MIKKIQQIINYKRKEEVSRKGGINENLNIYSFKYFTNLIGNNIFIEAFEKMQKIYVLNEDEKISLSDVYNALDEIHLLLNEF